MIKRVLIEQIRLTRGLEHEQNLKELTRDLKANGQQVPIVVMSDFTLVDGLRRVMALNTLGIKEIDAFIASNFEEVIEGLYLNHSGQFPDRLHRLWEIEQILSPLVYERRSRLASERQLGVSKTERRPSGAPLARTLVERVFGNGYDKVIQTYRLAHATKPPGWRTVLRDLETGEITVGNAYDQIRGKRPLMGNIRTVKDQEQLVNGAARQFEAVVLALEKLAWPIVIPVENRQVAIEQLRRNRGKLSRIIRLLEEAEEL